MIALFSLLIIAECAKPRAGDPILLVVISADPALASSTADVERAVRAASTGRLALLPREATKDALTAEGGTEERERAVIDARIVLDRAEDKFRELDDEEALSLIAKATTKLTAVHQAPGAIEQLARAHLVAGAIYLARGRGDAARQRLQRALDLDPALSPPRDRYAPEVLAELAGVRGAAAVRPTGRLIVRSGDLKASVFLDGRSIGSTPLELDAAGVGNHLLRVYAPGYLSAISSIQIGVNEDRLVEVRLDRDPELQAIERLLSKGELGSTLQLLSIRAGAERTLLATIQLADEPTQIGTATIALTLRIDRVGTAIAPHTDRRTLEAALDRALACSVELPAANRLAPALIGRAEARATALAKVPPPQEIFEKPWFWGAVFVATMTIASAAVLARTAGGPPEAVEVRLIPRP